MKRLFSCALLFGIAAIGLTLLYPAARAAEEGAADDARRVGLIASIYQSTTEVFTFTDSFNPDDAPTSFVMGTDIGIGSPDDLARLTGGETEQLFVRFSGMMTAPVAGVYEFNLESDDGSRMFLDGKEVIDNDGRHGPTPKRAQIELTAGDHELTVDYFNAGGGATCVLRWKVPGRNVAVVPMASLYHRAENEPKPLPTEPFKVDRGERITLIGGTLAERMQHDGWLETEFQKRFPNEQISFRHLGFSADAIDHRLRVDGYGSETEWLKRTAADTVFMFFGYSESFGGEENLLPFKVRLAARIRGMRQQRYNGETAASIVLFSPIAHEDLGDPNLPDGVEHNKQLKLYSDAMAQIADQQGVLYVDLFTPTLAAYKNSKEALTINGVHLNSAGNKLVAQVIAEALVPDAKASISPDEEAKLRAAIVDKNFYWFNRYQPTDGYNVHGGRADLNYGGITNRMVMNRENEVLEVMTANRDPAIWAAAQGKSYTVDDSNTPPFIEVKTNRPGPLPGGKHKYLGEKESLEQMKQVGEGMKVSLFASEEQFPELINPVQMAFDTKGRLFVAAWESYPHWKPKDEMNDQILILVDKDGDGRADECKVWADGLHNPTGFEFWNGGILVANAPDLLFLKDTDGDDKADVRTRVLHGLSSGDTHHTANSFVLGPGGALFFGEGTFHRTQIETPYGSVRNKNGCIWRVEPRTWKVDRHVPYGFANPHGHVIDRWGQGFVHDGTGAVPYHVTLFSGHIDYPSSHGGAPALYNRRTRPCPATEILSSEHFPEELQGNLLVENVIGMQGILQYDFWDDGSSFRADEVEQIMQSWDPNFRPVDIEIGPDGAIWFTDWANAIIGHMQHHIRDPNRDKTHGRVYRVTYEGRPLMEVTDLTKLSIEELLEQLKSPTDRVRYRTRIELSARPSDQVVAAATKWAAGLDKKDEQYEHHRLEALWVHQQHNIVNESLLDEVLRSPDYRARAAATRVLCYWRDRVEKPLDKLQVQVNDEHPRVRLEAVRALSFFREPKALEVTLEALAHPMDKYLTYTFKETTRQLEKFAQ